MDEGVQRADEGTVTKKGLFFDEVNDRLSVNLHRVFSGDCFQVSLLDQAVDRALRHAKELGGLVGPYGFSVPGTFELCGAWGGWGWDSQDFFPRLSFFRISRS